MPSQPPAALASAQEHFEARRYAEALHACRQALAEAPGDPVAEVLLGRALTEMGGGRLATLTLQRAVLMRPGDPEPLLALAEAHRRAGETGPARAALEEALAAPGPPEAVAAAGAELAELEVAEGAAEAALARSEAAVAAGPQVAVAHLARAHALVLAGRVEEARAALARAVELDAGMAQRTTRQAVHLRAVGHDAQCRRLLEVGRALQPDDPEIAHLHAAAGLEEAPARASDAYVATQFDRFAATFDERLSRLGYRPQELVARVAERLDGRTGLDVLDAGCGTGLCGPELRGLARRLVGVDLSGGMLARAEARGVYDELVRAELGAHLRENPGAWDLVFAADVLIYFGDLTELLTLCARALRPGGLLAFTVERGEQDVELRSTGRWAHSAGHLQQAAGAAGLALEVEERVLRTEAGKPVRSLLALALAAPAR